MDLIDFYNKWLKLIIPTSIKDILKKFINLDKHYVELHYQRKWVQEFICNKEKVGEYWVTYRYLNQIIEICKLNEYTKILDIGCGISTVLHYLNGEKYGIDPLADNYKKLYNYPQDITIIKGSAEKIPFPNNFFDVLFCTNALDHVEDITKSTTEIYRVLRPEGKFVLAVNIFEEHQKRNAAHPYGFTEDDLINLFSIHYKTLFKREAPWIATDRYVRGLRDKVRDELIMILEKIN